MRERCASWIIIKDLFFYRFPSSVMLFGRKLPKLAKSGNSEEILKILEKGDFGAEKYNESYQSFVEMEHRKEGLDILMSAHEKFPDDTVSIFPSLTRYDVSLFLLTSRQHGIFS